MNKLSITIILLLCSIGSIGWFGPRTNNALVASQDVLASSTDTHAVGTQSVIWKNGYFSNMRFKHKADAPSAISSFGTQYVKGSDSLPYWIKQDGTELAMTGSDPSNLLTITDTTASIDLTVTQSGRVITNDQATASVDANLPAITEGMNYKFIVRSQQKFNINPQANDIIELRRNASGDVVTLPSSGDRVSAASLGDSLVLVAASSDRWSVKSLYGDWKDID